MTGGRHSRENAMTVKLTQPLPAFRMDHAVLERLCGGVPPRLRGQRSAPDRLGQFGRVEGPDGSGPPRRCGRRPQLPWDEGSGPRPSVGSFNEAAHPRFLLGLNW